MEVVREFGRRPQPGCRVTLVARDRQTLYSGMLPGLVAGHYRREDCHIDLPRLCHAAGLPFVHAEATGIDRTAKAVLLNGAPPLRYRILSIDVGITPRLDEIEGAQSHAIVVKPISAFLPRWDDLLARCRSRDGPRRIVAVGGGAAGFELILAVQHRLSGEARAAGLDPALFSYGLVTSGRLLEEQNRSVQDAARRALDRKGVRLLEGSKAVAINPSGIALAGGGFHGADAALVSTHATAPDWLRATGLEVDFAGFLATGRTLQSLNNPDVFAAGDCATMVDDPRPKAGVFAVRQGPILAGNLRRRINGERPARHFPQRRWLSLLTTGDRYAIAGRGHLKVEGWWAWHWKDWIDRRWMRRYSDSAPDRRAGRR